MAFDQGASGCIYQNGSLLELVDIAAMNQVLGIIVRGSMERYQVGAVQKLFEGNKSVA